jgi:hypothetical protein
MKRLTGTMPVLNVADFAGIEKLQSTLSGRGAETVEGRT